MSTYENILWKFMLPRKKWYTSTVLLRLVFLDKEYSSKVFQPLLAVPHFSKVAVAEVFCEKGVLENLGNHKCFSVNFTRFSRTPFSYNTSGGCFWKAKSRSSRPEVFSKNGVLRSFAKFTGKDLCQSLLFTSLGLQHY